MKLEKNKKMRGERSTRLKPALQAVGFFLGLLLAAGSANDAMMDRLGLLGTFAVCMAWLGMSMLCAAGLGALEFGRAEAEEAPETSPADKPAHSGLRLRSGE